MTGHYAYFCPILSCRAKMVKRRNKATGKLFYGCSEYPKCSGTIEIPEREKLLELGCSELPGFETEGSS